MLTENDIADISQKIVDVCAPLAVGTFGSYAVGRPHERSDLDVFVINDPTHGSTSKAHSVRAALLGVIHPMDIIVFTAAEFEESVYKYLSFTWVIAKQARLYHWTDEAKRLVPSLLPRVFGS